MTRTEFFGGYEVNLLLSRDGSKIRGAVVLVGDHDRPGWRRFDGALAIKRRSEAKAAVLAALEGDPRWTSVAPSRRSMGVCARYGFYGPREGGAR
jgi:hypothetical protein